MSGYIGTQPVPQTTQTRDSFTATSNQTSFPTSGYTPNYLDVFLNGVKLAAADYTATNNSDVVLAVGAATGDILEVVAYSTFNAANVTGAVDFTVTGDITVNGTVDGRDVSVDGTKLDGIETSADVTDATNVTAAGALMDSELTNLAAVKAINQSLVTTASPTFAGVDVTGTVLADGLGVDGDGLLYSATNVEMRGNANVRISLGTAGTSGANNSSNWIYGNGTNLRFNNAGGYYSWETLGTERMRISSDGSVLVGKTAPNQDVAGIELSANDYILVTSTGTSAYLNRISSDGVIQEFRKDGTTVGSIFSGHGGSQVGIGTNTTGITFNPSTRSMMPANPSSTNPQLDATLDIGFSSVRWKDLYLSGGVYLGGTGAANKLDDYESGTWTPTLPNGGTVGTIIKAVYTKVGNLVNAYCNVYLNPTNNSTQFKIGGLPFASAGDNHGGGTLSYVGGMEVRYWSAPLVSSSSEAYFHRHDASTGVVLNNAFGGANRQFIMQLTYSLN